MLITGTAPGAVTALPGQAVKNEGRPPEHCAVQDNPPVRAQDESPILPGRTGTDEYIRYLESLFPGRKVDICDFGSEEDIRRYAMSHTGQFRITLSAQVLERMQSDPSFAQKCIDALTRAGAEQVEKIKRLPAQGKTLSGCGLILDADGETVQWIASVAHQAISEENLPSKQYGYGGSGGCGGSGATEAKSGISIEKTKARYIPARDLVKIARAANRQAVKRTISGIHAQIYQIRAGAGDRREKAVLISQADRVLLKARLKGKLLEKEELLDMQRRKADVKEQYRKSLQLKQLLDRRRQARKVREYGQIRDYYETPWERQARRSEPDCRDTAVIGQIYGPPVGGSVAISQVSLPSGGGITGATVDITV